MRWTGNLAVHQAFEIAGYFAAGTVYAATRARHGDAIPDEKRAAVIAGAAAGAAIGARLLFLLCDPHAAATHIADPTYLFFGGKTIVGGLLGGLIGVEWAKRAIGLTRSTGDLFVLPLIVAMAIGRIGCFLAGPVDRTEGKPTALPWGLAVGDPVRRHPVALYEIAFLLLLVPLVRAVKRRSNCEGDMFRTFLGAYLLFRLCIDFLKPDPRPILFGLTGIQWACVAGLGYYASVLSNDDRHTSLPFLRRRRVDLHDVSPEG